MRRGSAPNFKVTGEVPVNCELLCVAVILMFLHSRGALTIRYTHVLRLACFGGRQFRMRTPPSPENLTVKRACVGCMPPNSSPPFSRPYYLAIPVSPIVVFLVERFLDKKVHAGKVKAAHLAHTNVRRPCPARQFKGCRFCWLINVVETAHSSMTTPLSSSFCDGRLVASTVCARVAFNTCRRSPAQAIYPIKYQDSLKEFTIRGLELPADLYSMDDERISSALGYTAHLVCMLAKYLQVPLRYQVIYNASRYGAVRCEEVDVFVEICH